MEKNLGHATAYGYAKSKGYSGTEEEFAELMADYASVGQSAAQSAEQAAASAESASGSAATAASAAQTATSKASEAVTAAGTATTKASEANTSADTASAAATSAITSAQTATTAASTATTKASEAAVSANTATTAKTDAETARDAAAQSASEAAESARTLTIDVTLTQSGQAADAKVVGDEIEGVRSVVNATIANTTIPLISQWMLGSINTVSGEDVSNNARIRTVGFIDITGIDAITFTVQSGYKYWWYLYNDSGTLLEQRRSWGTTTQTINNLVIGNATKLRIVMSNTSDTAASVDYAQYLTVEATSTLKGLVDGNGEATSKIQSAVGVDIEETISDVQPHYYYSAFKQGDTVQIDVEWTFEGSGDKNLNIKDDTGAFVKVCYNQGTSTFTLPRDTKYLVVTLAKVSTVTSFTATYTIKSGLTLLVDDFAKNQATVFYVEKDGTGDFTRIIDAIEAGEQHNGAIVYVGAGTWDILDELGDDYLNAVSSNPSTWGIELKNNIHLIFAINSVVTANYTGTNENVMKYLSVFNSGEKGFTLENCTIRSSKIRYCVHDDRGSMTTPYHNKYINCDMHHDNTENTVFTGIQCIGGGLGQDGEIVIDGCIFESHNQWGGIVSWHNSGRATGKGKILLKDSYFKGHGTFRFSWYGTSPDISTAIVCGCSLGGSIVHRAENESATVENTAVVEWNNTVRS